MSYLRLVNPARNDITVSINGLDDAGVGGRDVVKVNLPRRATRPLSAADLESGRGAIGAVGDGAGKRHLTLNASQPVRVTSLMSSPTGPLTNLSTIPADFEELPGGRRLHRIRSSSRRRATGGMAPCASPAEMSLPVGSRWTSTNDTGQRFASLDLSLAGHAGEEDEPHMGVGILDDTIAAQEVAVAARGIGPVQHVEDRLVLLVHQHDAAEPVCRCSASSMRAKRSVGCG